MSDELPVDSLRRSGHDPEAFARFYRSRHAKIVAYFARRLHDTEAALDLTAETFAQAYVSRRRFRGSTPAAADAWLYKIAERKLIRYLKRGFAERRALQRLQIEAPRVTAELRARVEELADLAGMRSVLRSELVCLPEDQQRALHLRVVEDLANAEVASRLAISEPAARARVSRGLRVLANALERNELAKENSP